MNGKWHLITNTFWMTIICILVIYFGEFGIRDSALIVCITEMAIYLGALGPDADLKFKKIPHRWAGTHSTIFFIIPWILALIYPMVALIIALFMVSVGFHLLGDCKTNRDGMRGTYNICLYAIPIPMSDDKRFGLSGIQSTFWLLGNFWLSILILVVTVWILL